MTKISEHRRPSKTALEVVCRLYINGSLLGSNGRPHAIIELSAAQVVGTAYGDLENFPELRQVAKGEAVRCQLQWENKESPFGWRIVGFAMYQPQGEAGLHLLPTTLCTDADDRLQYQQLVDCIKTPALRQFAGGILSDAAFATALVTHPTDRHVTNAVGSGLFSEAIRSMLHFHCAPGLTVYERDLGAVALLFARPGIAWLRNRWTPLGPLDHRLSFPKGAIAAIKLKSPQTLAQLQCLWEIGDYQKSESDYAISSGLRVAYALARSHAKMNEQFSIV
jgi:hypothetical protein